MNRIGQREVMLGITCAVLLVNESLLVDLFVEGRYYLLLVHQEALRPGLHCRAAVSTPPGENVKPSWRDVEALRPEGRCDLAAAHWGDGVPQRGPVLCVRGGCY